MKIKDIIEPYEHDCENCQWVGWFSPWRDKPPMNVYICESPVTGKTTVVIRFSSEGSDYWSATAGELIKGNIAIMESEEDND